MSIFFGAISLSKDKIPADLIESAESIFKEFLPGHNSHRSPGFFAVWKDLGIWNSTSSKTTDACVCVLAGDPIYYDNNHSCSAYPSSLCTLSTTKSTSHFLKNSHGTFCGFRYNIDNKEIEIFSDKLGVRPIYWGIQNDVLFFSSALWIVEKHRSITKRPCAVSISEVAAFGFPLSTRTPYDKINTIGSGEVISVQDKTVKVEQYWDWHSNTLDVSLYIDLLTPLKAIFETSIKDRLSDQPFETAFLSGGMDSRLIVSKLVEIGADVSTLNFAPDGTQDLAFGALAADALGTNHFELPLGPDDFGNKQVLAINTWTARNPDVVFNRQIWSGDGGSVGLGHVYLNDEIISLVNQDKFAEAAELISKFNKWNIPQRLLKHKFQHLAYRIPTAIHDELNRWRTNTPERAAYLFLMTNDQRRHLADHFEKIHIKGFDFKLPFFDSRFIQLIISLPITEFIGHKIYNQWLLSLPGQISKVPWQSYPGHHPCPLPTPEGLRYQWVDCYDTSDSKKLSAQNERLCLDYGFKCLLGNSPLSPITLILAGVLSKLKLRDQQFFATYARPFVKYYY